MVTHCSCIVVFRRVDRCVLTTPPVRHSKPHTGAWYGTACHLWTDLAGNKGDGLSWMVKGRPTRCG